jgi:VanZ family protein
MMNANNKKLKFFFPAIIWGLIILYLSSNAGIQLPPSFWDFLAIDKIGHLVFYGIFTILIAFGFYKNKKVIRKKELFNALIISSIYGIAMELMQYSFFPNRYFEVLDIIANISGSLMGILFFKHIFLKLGNNGSTRN